MRCVFTTVLILYEINLLNFNLLISLYYNPGNLFINLKLIQMYELAVWRLKSLFNRIFISNPENEFSMFGFSTFLLKKEYIIFIFFSAFWTSRYKTIKTKARKEDDGSPLKSRCVFDPRNLSTGMNGYYILRICTSQRPAITTEYHIFNIIFL